MTGTDAFAQLAPATVGRVRGAAGHEGLFVGVPAANASGSWGGQPAGRVVAVPLGADFAGDSTLPALMATATALWDGDRDHGRFGARMLAADVDGNGVDDAVFAAPLRTEDVTEELYGAEQGVRLLLWSLCCIGKSVVDNKFWGLRLFARQGWGIFILAARNFPLEMPLPPAAAWQVFRAPEPPQTW